MERPSRRKLYSEEKREAYPLEQTKTTLWCRCCAGCAGAGSCTAFCGRKLAGKAQPKAGVPDGAAAGDRRDHGSGRCDLYVVSRNDSVLNFSDLQVGSELTSDVSRQELLDVKQQIEQTGCPILGTVLNQVDYDNYMGRKYYKSYSKYGKYGYYRKYYKRSCEAEKK